MSMPPAAKEKPSEALTQRLADAIVTERAAGAALALWTPAGLELAAAGYANVAAGIEADNQTIFQIGSVTKVFTASLLLVLRQQGLVDLDRPVSEYLPEFRIAGGTPPTSLTVRSLLNYTSGIAGEFFADFGPDEASLARYVEACADLPLVFDPQSMRGYSSTAYCVAGRIAEVVLGLPFNQALVRHLIAPLGQQRTAFYTHDVARFRTAIGHVASPDGGFKQAEQLRLPHCMSPTGASLSMTAEDLLAFGLMHMHGGTAQSGARILSADNCAEMITSGLHLPPDDSPVMIGWAQAPTDRGRIIAASGQTIEHNAVLAFSPQRDFAIAILANTAGAAQRLFLSLGAQLLKERADTALQAPPALEADPSSLPILERYAGHFTNHTRVEVSAIDSALEARFHHHDAAVGAQVSSTMKFTPLGGDRFAASAGPALRFLFQHGDAIASHISYGGAIFARCDANGATRYPTP
jgi:CubicO group peptidase (beta-lactamase class C family)